MDMDMVMVMDTWLCFFLFALHGHGLRVQEVYMLRWIRQGPGADKGTGTWLWSWTRGSYEVSPRGRPFKTFSKAHPR